MSKALDLLKQIRRVDGNMSREQNQRYAELEKYLTPPTSDEVCKALSEQLKETVFYSEKTKQFICKYLKNEWYVTETYGDGEYSINSYIKPHLIEMIGKFYESLEDLK